MSDNENGKSVSRRTLLGTTAAAAGVGLAGGVAFSTDGKGLVTAADAQTKTAPPKAPAARPAVAEGRSSARRTRRILHLLLQWPVRRNAHCRASVDARIDARSGIQPLQRDRLGPDQRESEGADRGASARDPRIPQDSRRHLHERRPASPACLLHRRHL